MSYYRGTVTLICEWAPKYRLFVVSGSNIVFKEIHSSNAFFNQKIGLNHNCTYVSPAHPVLAASACVQKGAIVAY